MKHTDGAGNDIDVNGSVHVDGEWNVIFEFQHPYFDADAIMNLAIYDHQVIGTPNNPTEPNYDFNSDPLKFTIGAGPFVLDQYSTTSHDVKLIARNDYWNGPIALSAMEFKKYGNRADALADLKDGKIDIIDAQAYLKIAEVENVVGVAYQTFPDFGKQIASVNMDHPIFGTGVDTPLGRSDPSRAAEAAKYLRLAISHTSPREFVANEIFGELATPATSLWPNKAEGYDNSLEPHTYDLDLAREYIKKAGYTILPSNTKINLPLDNIYLTLFIGFSVAIISQRKIK